LEGQLKEKDSELLKRDRVITDLRVRLPASSDRDAVFEKVASQSAKSPRDEDYESSQAVRVATSTVSSLQVDIIQGDHLSGKPGNVREFDSCQGNVRDFAENRNCQGKNLVREKLPKTVNIVNCIFVSIRVFSRSLLCLKC